MLRFVFLLVLCVVASMCGRGEAAGNEPINPLPVDEFNQPTADFYQDLRQFLNDEIPARDKENKQVYAVVQGGSHGLSASMISAAFSTIAYTNWQQRVNQPPAAINYTTVGCNNDDQGWVIISARAENQLAQFERNPGTDYFVDCTSSVQPLLPDNSAWLMRVAFTAGAITTAEAIGNIIIGADAIYNVTTNITTNSKTQWYIAPGGRINVSPGVVLTFGSCPNAGQYQIFNAMNDANSGRVDFAPWACEHTYAEWWGADPTGAVDSTLHWRRALEDTKPGTPIHCQGDYWIKTQPGDLAVSTSHAFPAALVLRGQEQILGKGRQQSVMQPTTTVWPCRFSFTGTGIAIGTVQDTAGKSNIWLENLFIWDKESTGNFGLDLWAIRAGGIKNIMVRGFDTGMWLGANYYYAHMDNVYFDESRIFCADLSGAAFNGVHFTNFTCNTTSLDLDTGIRIGSAPGLYGEGHNVSLQATIEVYAGTALSIARQVNFTLDTYIELYGEVADHATLCQVCFNRMEGGTFNILLHHSLTGGPVTSPLNMGIRVVGVATSGPNSKQMKFTGDIDEGFNIPLLIDFDQGSFGHDTSGLTVQGDVLKQFGVFSSGVMLGNNVITHGSTPLIDQGRGSGSSVWRAGDIIWLHGGPANLPQLTNVLRIVNAEGNPPAGISSFMLNSLTAAVLDATATPSVKTNQIWNTRVSVGAGADITDFIDEFAGMCMTVRATAARTIVDNGTTIDLPSGNFAMTANDVLELCIDGGVWRQKSRTDYP